MTKTIQAHTAIAHTSNLIHLRPDQRSNRGWKSHNYSTACHSNHDNLLAQTQPDGLIKAQHINVDKLGDILFMRILHRELQSEQDDATYERSQQPIMKLPADLKPMDVCDHSDSGSNKDMYRHSPEQMTLTSSLQTMNQQDWIADISNCSLSDIDGEYDSHQVGQAQPLNCDDQAQKLYSGFKVRNPRNGKMRTHYRCEMQDCNKTFTQICNVKRHLLIHLEIKEFKCGNCEKTFSQKANMQRHERTCTKPNRHVGCADHTTLHF